MVGFMKQDLLRLHGGVSCCDSIHYFDYGRLSSSQLAELSAKFGGRLLAVIPLGATEQHGRNLPLATDNYSADLLSFLLLSSSPSCGSIDVSVDRLDRKFCALILPLVGYGFSCEHLGRSGTLSLRLETLVNLLRDIALGLSNNGIKKLVFFNGHGGNSALLTALCSELRAVNCQYSKILSWQRLSLDCLDDLISEQEKLLGFHGGVFEQALMFVAGLSSGVDQVDSGGDDFGRLSNVAKISSYYGEQLDIDAKDGYKVDFSCKTGPFWHIDDISASGITEFTKDLSQKQLEKIGNRIISRGLRNFHNHLRVLANLKPVG